MRQQVDRWLGHVLWIIMAIMVINVLWQVFSRFVLRSPSSFTDELARYLMIWIGLLGAAYVSGRQGHISLDVLTSRVQAQSRQRMARIVAILIASFALLALVIGGGRLVYISYILGQKSPALQLPLAYIYMVLPISGVVIIYYKVHDILYKCYD